MIEIDIGSLVKSRKRIWVKPTATRVGHYRMQEVGRKEDEKEEEKEVKYEPVPGLYGRLSKYDSMPGSIKIPEKEIEKMDSISKESRKLDAEIICGINRRTGNMVLSKASVGEARTCSLSDVKSNFGFYHTHPPTTEEMRQSRVNVINSPSFEDILVLISKKVKPSCLKIMMAHDVEHNDLWVAIVSGDTQRMLNDMKQSRIYEYFKLKKSLSCAGETHEEIGKNHRAGIKDFCDFFKIKLYYGQPNSKLEEYRGDW